MFPVKIVFTTLTTLVGLVMALVLFLPIYAVLGFFSTLGVVYRAVREYL